MVCRYSNGIKPAIRRSVPSFLAHTLLAASAALMMTASGAYALDAQFPDWSGQWRKPAGVGNQWDQARPLGRGQQAPLTPEYQAIFDASLADQEAGGQGNDPPARCVPFGMPRVMTAVFNMEIVVTPPVTYILFDHSMPRRVFTDGRAWPKDIEPTFLGTSIGTWLDTDGDGRYDTLEIETRGLKGPRTYEGSGLPLHSDNETVIKERISQDRANTNLLHDEITTIDHALLRPWTVIKNYRRDPDPVWFPLDCAEDNHHVLIGGELYYLGADDVLMPAKKDQPPPDLHYFKPK